jgi:hypothetical protein
MIPRLASGHHPSCACGRRATAGRKVPRCRRHRSGRFPPGNRKADRRRWPRRRRDRPGTRRRSSCRTRCRARTPPGTTRAPRTGRSRRPSRTRERLTGRAGPLVSAVGAPRRTRGAHDAGADVGVDVEDMARRARGTVGGDGRRELALRGLAVVGLPGCARRGGRGLALRGVRVDLAPRRAARSHHREQLPS